MSKTLPIQQLTTKRLQQLNLKTEAIEIKRAYQRNLKHRRSRGRVSRQLVADEITSYLITNNIVSTL